MRLPPIRLSRHGYVAITVAGVLLPTLFLSFLGLYLVRELHRFQGEILQDYSRFSVEYAASEVERVLTTAEHDIASYLQFLALVEGFEPQAELVRVEEHNPLIEYPFALPAGGVLVVAAPADSGASTGAAPADSSSPAGTAPPVPHAPADEGPSDAEPPPGVPSPEGAARAAAIVRRILDPQTEMHIRLSEAVHYYQGAEAGRPYQVTIFPYANANGEPAGVMGFFLDPYYFRTVLVGRVLDTTIHAAEGRFAPDFGRVLTLVVRDDQGREVYAHRHGGKAPDLDPTRDLATASLDEVLPGWRIGITYSDPSSFGWAGRVVGLQMLLLAAAAVLVVAASMIVLRFGLRQMELSRVKSHFVSNITHELKTPLAAIRLYTETLQQERVHDRAEASRFLAIIHRETVRLTALINNLLDFARIEAGERRYRFAEASVGDVVREVVDTYAYQFRNKGFDVQLAIEPGLPPARIDRDAIGQALLNLLDNAVKYSRDVKHLEVDVRLNGAEGPAPAIAVAVTDRGIGIPAGEQTKIFEAFYRVEKGLEHDVKGSGLGLAVVHNVAQAHGGSVQVRSHPGAGSTFTLWLPVPGTLEPAAPKPEEGKA